MTDSQRTGAVNVAVIYYSATGSVYRLAEAEAAAQAADKAGALVRLRKVRELAPDEAIATNAGWAEHRQQTQDVPEANLDDLEWADVLLFGTPTRYGLPTAQLKQFIDMSGPLWAAGKLVNKVASSFTSAATRHGGQETTITALNQYLLSLGLHHRAARLRRPGSVPGREPLRRQSHLRQRRHPTRRNGARVDRVPDPS